MRAMIQGAATRTWRNRWMLLLALAGLQPLISNAAQAGFATPTFVRAWGTPGSGQGQLNLPNAIAVNSSGNVYVGDTGNRRIQAFDSTGAFLLSWGPSGADGPSLLGITGLAFGASGNLYVSDLSGGQIDIFTPSGGVVGTFGSAGSLGGPGGTFFNGPYDVACSASGDVYAPDPGNARVQQFDANGIFIRSWGHCCSGDGNFSIPRAVCVEPDGTVCVGDNGSTNRCLQAFSSTGAFLRRWGSSGSGPGQFASVVGLAADSQGSIYVADASNNRIDVFSADGSSLGQWGTTGSGNGQFVQPMDVAVFGSSVYVLDSGNDRVQEFTLAPVAATPTSWGKVKATYR